MRTRDTLDLELREGDVLQGRYRLIGELGSGSMGRVYEAEQLGLGRTVALKLMRGTLLGNRKSMERFRTEALAASRVNHPNAVAIYDFGVTGDGVPYLVMERLRGQTLSALLAERTFPPGRAVAVAAQVLSAVAEAHSVGVVHRDLKSDNVVVETVRSGADFAKVLDFGIARLVDAPEEGSSAVVGTPEYMSPEQVQGAPVGEPTDLYAVGVMLFEMLVGHTPFAGRSTAAILSAHLEEVPPSVREAVHECPPSLAMAIARALEKDPNQRFPDAENMREALLSAVLGIGTGVICRRCGTRRHDDTGPCPGCGLGEHDLLRLDPSTPRTATLPFGSDTQKSRVPQHTPAKGTPTPPTGVPDERMRQSLRDLAAALGRPFVGREAEVTQVERFLAGDGGQVLAIVGPPGVGKTRVLTQGAARATLTTYAAGPDPTGLRQSWYPILSMLEAMLELPSTPSAQAITAAVQRAGLGERDVPGLVELFGREGPLREADVEVRRREVQAAALRALRRSRLPGRRLALAFLDVDRFDQPSRDLVAELAATFEAGAPRVILTVCDPALLPPSADVLKLSGLPAEETLELCNLLAGPDAQAVSAGQLLERTDGIPAAIEHLAGWLGAGYPLADAPRPLVDLIAARLGRLPPSARRVLQVVAGHGLVAQRARVSAAITELDPDGDAIATLYRGGFLGVDGHDVSIPSRLVAEVVVACTPAEARRGISRHILDNRAGLSAAVVGEHGERAGDPALAYEAFMDAGDDACRRLDERGGAAWYARAAAAARASLAEGEAMSDLIVRACLRESDALAASEQLALAGGCLDEAEAFGPDVADQAFIARTRARLAIAGRDPRAASVHLRRAIGMALRVGDYDFLCDAYLDLARALADLKDVRGAKHELEEAIQLLTLGEGLAKAARPARLWQLGHKLADIAIERRELIVARQWAEAALAQAELCGSIAGQARAHALLGDLAEATGRSATATNHRTRALDHARRLGDRRTAAELLLSCVAPEDTSPTARRARELARELAAEVGWKMDMS